VKLFVQGAKRAKPDFEVTTANMNGIARICKLVQGMPLGILLAASWVAMLSPDEIAAEITKSIDFLESAMSDVPARQRSIRAVFDYSWDLLTEDERAVFMKLAVFRGGFTREAAEVVAGANLRILMSLMNKSLLRRDATSGRYDIHELLRQYADDKLESSEWANETQLAYMHYFAAFLKKREGDIKYKRQSEALREIEADFGNVQASFKGATTRHDALMLDTMSEALFHFCAMRNYWLECNQLFYQAQQVLSLLGDGEQAKRAWGRVALRRARIMTLLHDNPQEKETIRNLLESCLEVARFYNNDVEVALCYCWLASLVNDTTVLPYLQESLAIADKTGDDYCIKEVLEEFGGYYHWHGIYNLALEYYQKWETLCRKMGDKHGLSWNLNTTAGLFCSIGRFGEAEARLREARPLQYEIGQFSGLMWNMCMFAELLCYQGDFNAAQLEAEKALQLAIEKNIIGNEQLASTILGFIWCIRGDNWGKAQEYCSRSYAIDPDHVFSAGWKLWWGLALIEIKSGKYEAARTYNCKAFKLAQGIPVPSLVSIAIEAIIQASMGKYETAVAWISLVFHHPAAPIGMLKNWLMLNDVLEQLKNELGTEQFNTVWEHGKTLDIKTVVKELLIEFGENPA
jgi:tetratricopeptide (TPR) repeat protein